MIKACLQHANDTGMFFDSHFAMLISSLLKYVQTGEHIAVINLHELIISCGPSGKIMNHNKWLLLEMQCIYTFDQFSLLNVILVNCMKIKHVF